MSELAADNIPVAVSLRVLKLSRQPYYRWRNQQITNAELIEAYRANALLDAHRDDPEYGYRFLVGEAAEAGEEMCERTAWRWQDPVDRSRSCESPINGCRPQRRPPG